MIVLLHRDISEHKPEKSTNIRCPVYAVFFLLMLRSKHFLYIVSANIINKFPDAFWDKRTFFDLSIIINMKKVFIIWL